MYSNTMLENGHSVREYYLHRMEKKVDCGMAYQRCVKKFPESCMEKYRCHIIVHNNIISNDILYPTCSYVYAPGRKLVLKRTVVGVGRATCHSCFRFGL